MQHDKLRILAHQTGLYSANAPILKHIVQIAKTSMNMWDEAQIKGIAAPLRASGYLGGLVGAVFNPLLHSFEDTKNLFKDHKNPKAIPDHMKRIGHRVIHGYNMGQEISGGKLADDLFNIKD
jgi:hypothetical protein